MLAQNPGKVTWRSRAGAFLAVLAIGLSGCAAPANAPEGAEPAEILAGCCREAQQFPTWAAELTFGPPSGELGPGEIILRDPYIGNRPEVRALLEAHLRPLDLIVQRYEGRLGGLVSPGRFSHTSIYLGTEAQLRAAGLWHLPDLAPWRPRIAEGFVLLDAMHTDVHLRDMSELLEVDALAILRPRLTASARAGALRRGLGLMGRYFDTDYRLEDDEAIFCTELVHRAMPDLGLPITRMYGRDLILPDAIAAGALVGALPLDFVGYIEGSPGGGVRARSAAELAGHMARHWPAPGTSDDPAPFVQLEAATSCG
jgi:hypothetical protein